MQPRFEIGPAILRIGIVATCGGALATAVASIAQNLSYARLSPAAIAYVTGGPWYAAALWIFLGGSFLQFGTMAAMAWVLARDLPRWTLTGVLSWTVFITAACISFAAAISIARGQASNTPNPAGSHLVELDLIVAICDLARPMAGIVANLFIGAAVLRCRYPSVPVGFIIFFGIPFRVFGLVFFRDYAAWVIVVNTWIFPIYIISVKVAITIWLVRVLRAEMKQTVP